MAGVISLVTSAGIAQTTYIWQGNIGSSNAWSNTAVWSPAAVPNSPRDVVVFSNDFTATATTISLGGSNYTVGALSMTDTATATPGKINFEEGTITLDNGVSKPVINFSTGSRYDNFINTVLTGTNGLEKTGGGIAQISGATNIYIGTTKISGGGLRIIRNNNLGDQAVGSGIDLAGGTLYIRPDAGSFALDNGGSAKRDIFVTAGTSSAPSAIQVEGTSSVEVSGNLSSVAGAYFRKTDTGSLRLSGSNNAIGRVELNGGTVFVSGILNNTEGLFIAKVNSAGSSTTTVWTGEGSVATGTGAALLLNDGGASVTNSSLLVTAGTLNVGDGTNSGRFVVGGKGIGAATISGGALSVKANKEVSIGSFVQYGGNGGNGTLTVSGNGLFQALGAGNFYVGYGQTITGPGATNFAGTGVINLTGGTLETGRTIFTGPGATGTFNLNGGVLKAAAANTNWIATTNNIIGGSGITIDTSGFAAAVAQELRGVGALSKKGEGTLTLTAANTYEGGTTVTAGTLDVKNANGSATGAGSVTVEKGAILTGTGTVAGSATINGTLSPGTR